MTGRRLLIVLFAVFSVAANAQNCNSLIATGRAFLGAQDITNAYLTFSEAVRLCPNDQTGRVFLAATRLLRVPNLTATETLLDRLGVTTSNRNIYAWLAEPSRDTNRHIVFPTGTTANEITSFLRTNLLVEIASSVADLSLVTSSNLLITLSTGETRRTEVTLDYGDIQMLRAALRFAQYVGYTLHSCNLEAQLTDLTRMGQDGDLTIERFLVSYTNLLTFANPGDLLLAKDAVLQGAIHYVEASDLIRARPSNTVRLFNLDPDEAEKEMRFRTTLIDLTNSLAQATVLRINTNYVVHLESLYDGAHPMRPLVPRFLGNAVILGSLPDTTLGGSVFGLTRGRIEEFFDKFLRTVPSFQGPPAAREGRFHAQMNTLRQKPYLLQGSDDLFTWYDLLEFIADGSTVEFQDVEVGARGQRYFRLVDLEDFIFFEGSVVDACSLAPVSGAIVSTDLDERTAITDINGRFFLLTRTAKRSVNNLPAYTVAARDYQIADGWFYPGENPQILIVPRNMSPPPNDNFADRSVLAGLPLVISSTTCGATEEANDPAGGNSVWFSWTSAFDGEVVLLSRGNGSQPAISIYTGDSLEDLQFIVGSGFGSEVRFEVQAGTTYQVSIASFDQVGHISSVLSAPPMLVITSPQDGDSFSAPAQVVVEGSASDPDGQIKSIELFGDYNRLATLTNSPFSYLWNTPGYGDHELEIVVTDNSGIQTSQYASFTVRPGNDSFTNRMVLSGSTVGFDSSNQGATLEPEDPIIGEDFGGPSVWFAWRSPFDGPVTISAEGSRFDENASLIGVFTGDTIENLMVVGENVRAGYANYSYISFTASSGTEYQILVSGFYYVEGGPFTLRLVPTAAPFISITSPTNDAVLPSGTNFLIQTFANDPDGQVLAVDFFDYGDFIGRATNAPFSLVASNRFSDDMLLQAKATDNSGAFVFSDVISVSFRPLNDNFPQRILLSGNSVRATGSNQGATRENGEPAHNGNFNTRSVWWAWTTSASGPVTISTIGSDFDTLLAVYTGTAVSALTLIANDDDSGIGGTSRVSFPAVSGVSYMIAVDGFSGDTGNIILNITSP